MSLERKVAKAMGQRLSTDEGAKDVILQEAQDFLKAIRLPVEDWKIFFEDGRWWLFTHVGDQFEEDVYWLAVDTRNGIEFEREYHA